MFRESVQRSQNTFLKSVNELIERNPRYIQPSFNVEEPLDLSSLTPLHSHQGKESLVISLAATAMDFAMLLLYALIALLASVIIFLRYDVR